MFARFIAAMTFFVVSSSPIHGQSATIPPFRDYSFAWLVGGSLELGGDRFADFVFTDGDTQTMRAGQGVTAFGGLVVYPTAVPQLGLQGTIGFKYVTTAADNANITLTRVPVDARATWSFTPDVSLGAGLTYHRAIKFRGDGFLQDVAFDPSFGASLRVGWRWIAATYTSMTYVDDLGFEYDATAFGIALSAELGKR